MALEAVSNKENLWQNMIEQIPKQENSFLYDATVEPFSGSASVRYRYVDPFGVMPAQAGIQGNYRNPVWTPAFAGVTQQQNGLTLLPDTDGQPICNHNDRRFIEKRVGD